MINLIEDYNSLETFLIWFHPESTPHYYALQPDIISVKEYLKVSHPDHIIPALQDAKRLLELPEFPYEEIASCINRRFEDEKKDVKPWFLSVLKLLEEEAAKQGIEIPEELKGLWKQ